jgi:GNAT superfamily N-acetyltransferase
MTTDDVADGLVLSGQNDWNQTEEDWRLLLEPPSVFRAAVLDGRVVGCAGAVVYGDRLAWVCMVLVDRTERGRGLGTRLVEQVLARLPPVAAVGLDATAKGRPVYQRLGFGGASTLARLRAVAPAGGFGGFDVPGAARPLTESDLPSVLERDRAAFGADRGPLLRHALSTRPEYAWCVGGPRGIEAYAFGRRGRNADQIGPIVADSFHAARDVLTACLARHPGRPFFVDATPWPGWRTELARLGFREQRDFTRKYRAGSTHDDQAERVYGATGPEFG